MQIPTPIYERIPQCYVLIGLLLITDGLYLGFDYTIAFGYIAVGLLSCAWGFGIFVTRLVAGRKRQLDERGQPDLTNASESRNTIRHQTV